MDCNQLGERAFFMTTKETVFIPDAAIEEKAKYSGYWAQCLVFWNQVKDKEYKDLTKKQKTWLIKIERKLNANDWR